MLWAIHIYLNSLMVNYTDIEKCKVFGNGPIYDEYAAPHA